MPRVYNRLGIISSCLLVHINNFTCYFRNEYPGIKDRSGSVEMPDVLLTLKHPLGQMSPSTFGCPGSAACQAPSASLSYTVHPQVHFLSSS